MKNINDIPAMQEYGKKAWGRDLAQFCDYTGTDLLDIIQIALEESNYHTFNKELTLLRNTKELESNMEYCRNML
tara:strand:+ start:64 stop:285 length:222 start_codon:yes stop_codon:yes gene_type:complete